MEEMATITEVINDLRQQGYLEDFNLQQACIQCREGHFSMLHDEFEIDSVYRFEGNTDPADEATVYAISSPRYGVKGILVNGGGIYTDELTDEMLAKLAIRPKD